jgi:hypothetical protein
VIIWGREQVWKRKADYAEKLRGMCRSKDGLVVWRFWTGYRTFSAAPVASQTIVVSIREFGFEEVTERENEVEIDHSRLYELLGSKRNVGAMAFSCLYICCFCM